MRSKLRRAYIRDIAKLPQIIYPKVRQKMEQRHGVRFAAQCDLERFLLLGDTELKKESTPVRVIPRGLYRYDFFNICFLNDVLSNCLRAICDGYLPRVEILRENGENIWDDFFEQPFSENEIEGRTITVQETVEKEAIPRWTDIYDSDKISLYGNLYNKIPVFKKEVSEYIQDEITCLLTARKVLGVLCRGTDYTKTKPSMHPVQPTENEIIRKVKEVFYERNYDYIYLATEDSSYETLFRSEFGDRILINKRQYYDSVFEKKNLRRIREVHFERENDSYYKGLEYISSLIILSKCQGLVAGNCGGTQAAVFWNGGRYEDKYVFNLGLYP